TKSLFKWILIMLGSDFVFVMMALLPVTLLFALNIEFVRPESLTMAMTSPFIILFLTVVGAYLFFRSSVSLIFKTLKKSKNGRV
ncbi:hypothetical protein P7584_15515, partial [Staphylococcus aureus]|nr:hypothetical protein [Staphylococcus aureus]